MAIALVLAVSVICHLINNLIGYKVVALLLLMTVSLAAMLFEILPVLSAAVLSAFIWNYLFIPPVFTFHIHSAEDTLMFLLYFFIALVNAVLTFKIREAETKARDKEEKEKTIRLYNTLLHSLSHELRTPISAILSAVDVLKENKFKLSVDVQHELLDEIDTAAIRLNRQVENLLNMSRLESATLQPSADWCDVNELIYSVIQKIPNRNQHVIHFQPVEGLPLFKLDGGLLEQVLHNLIHNAIQYTPEKTMIRIDAANQSDNCVIMIADNGTGFPAAEMEQVFEKFHRLPGSKAGGSGLGLSIVKGFVEAMNGKVKLENNTEGGATFTITIPAATSFLSNLKNE